MSMKKIEKSALSCYLKVQPDLPYTHNMQHVNINMLYNIQHSIYTMILYIIYSNTHYINIIYVILINIIDIQTYTFNQSGLQLKTLCEVYNKKINIGDKNKNNRAAPGVVKEKLHQIKLNRKDRLYLRLSQ